MSAIDNSRVGCHGRRGRARSCHAGAVLAILWLGLGIIPSLQAQYPNVAPDIAREAAARQAAADRRSAEAFARALPVIQGWAAKGKP